MVSFYELYTFLHATNSTFLNGRQFIETSSNEFIEMRTFRKHLKQMINFERDLSVVFVFLYA